MLTSLLVVRLGFDFNVVNVRALVDGHPQLPDDAVHLLHSLLVEVDHRLVQRQVVDLQVLHNPLFHLDANETINSTKIVHQ
jgi:hypothetical protein